MRIISLTLATLVSASAAAAFENFRDERLIVDELIHCPAGILSTTPGLPELWSCILPGAEVVKVFINSDENGNVANVRLMWNDWTRDLGYGIHTDEETALDWLTALASRYAPDSLEEVLDVFSTSSNATIRGINYTMTYTYFRGPAIDERILTVESN